MKRALRLLGLIFLAAASTADAQPVKEKFHRIGYLAAAPGSSPFFVIFKQRLLDLGYVEGKNFAIEYRSSQEPEQLQTIASEFVKRKVDLIVAQGPVSRVVKSATSAIPIVFGFSGDPVEAGLVDSLARPGRNMTGMSFMAQDLAGKRIELLKEASPRISRIAIVSTRTHPGEKNELRETQAAGFALKVDLQYLPVTTTGDIDQAFDAIVKDRADAMLTFPDAVTLSYRTQIAGFAAQRRLPTMFGWRQYVDAGGLISYGPSLHESYRRLAGFADKILRGAKPATLPVEQPTKFELIINLTTARQIGLTIAPNVLARADRVIR